MHNYVTFEKTSHLKNGLLLKKWVTLNKCAHLKIGHR